jgi:hypothetical protein
LYKSREGVEKHFETFKSELGADKMYLSVNAALKIPKCAGLKIHKNQTSVDNLRGLANVEHGGIFNDSGHCPRRGTGKRLEKHQ